MGKIWEWILWFITDKYVLGFISIVSFAFSIITYFLASKVNKNVKKLKEDTINKVRFNSYRTTYITKLKDYSDSIKRTGEMPDGAIMEITTFFTTLNSYKEILTEKDCTRVHQLSIDHDKNVASLKNRPNNEFAVHSELKVVTELITILENGTYCI